MSEYEGTFTEYSSNCTAWYRYRSYVPRDYYEANPELKKAIDMIHSGYFSPELPDLFHDLTYNLLNHDQ